MPILTFDQTNPTVDGRQSERAMEIRRGVVRQFSKMGVALMAELTLANGRRADLIGLDQKGNITIIEIKSSIEDFRVDKKWPEYKTYCDQFYFATLGDVPEHIFPEAEGLIIADAYGCEIIRDSEPVKLSGAARKSISLRFARTSALRLERVLQYCETTGSALPQDLQEIAGA